MEGYRASSLRSIELLGKMTGLRHAEFCLKCGKLFQLGSTRNLLTQIPVFIGEDEKCNGFNWQLIGD